MDAGMKSTSLNHHEEQHHYRISSVSFLPHSGEDIVKISSCNVRNVETFDSLHHPSRGGLYDPALGPTDQYDTCITCGLQSNKCPGHFGHISLPLPVFHPLFFKMTYKLLKSTCWCCHKLLATSYTKTVLKAKLELLDRGLVSEARDLESLLPESADAELGTPADQIIDPDSTSTCVMRFVAECIRNSDTLEHADSTTKHLVACRSDLISRFFTNDRSTRKSPKCPKCQAPVPTIRQEQQVGVFKKPLDRKKAAQYRSAWLKQHPNADVCQADAIVQECIKQKAISPLEARDHLRAVLANDSALLKLIYREPEESPSSLVDALFMNVISVPPSQFRPISMLAGRKYENPQTVCLLSILQDSVAIQELIDTKGIEKEQMSKTAGAPVQSLSEQLHVAWMKLQTDVNGFIDSDLRPTTYKNEPPNGIKQILEKKTGLFRQNMMGKRVNYAARSVISPDPNINMDEVGVPLVFAIKLTYPEPVTPWNSHELTNAIINGPMKHPGATHIEMEDGMIVRLNRTSLIQRRGIAKQLLTPSSSQKSKWNTKKVHRHLKNGDILLMNRQPTLHKPSIMAHKARVLPGERTLRLHYANCKTYNADFDGDEMNLHFPQNELARAEASCLVSTPHQYLVPKDGSPLSGLIQDHIVAAVIMTSMDQTFDRNEYHQLLYSALPESKRVLRSLQPAYLKPARLWTGKQIVSTVVLNIIPASQHKVHLQSKSKVTAKEWTKGLPKSDITAPDEDPCLLEDFVVFREGEMLCGILDKSQIGPSEFGLVHACHEIYGGVVANQLLTAFGRLFSAFLQLHHGFTLGIEDILVKSKADRKRMQAIATLSSMGKDASVEAFGIDDVNSTDLIEEKYREAHHANNDHDRKMLDYCVKKRVDQATNNINSICMGRGLHKPFPRNCLQLMVLSGAKGSSVNCMQISSLLGQIELEGQRPPLMPSGRSLPSFLPYDLTPRARGFVSGRFLTGIKPQEYFFHCMAGREGLIDTAVKTSRSGYLQRCLVKHMEGISVGYDQTVRESDASVVQFLYGEDGMDVCKTRYLDTKQFPFLANNYPAVMSTLNPSAAEGRLHEEEAPKYHNKVVRWMAKYSEASSRGKRTSGFLTYHNLHLPDYDMPGLAESGKSIAAETAIADWYALDDKAKAKFSRSSRPCPDPVNSHYRSDQYFGALPEKLLQTIESYKDYDKIESTSVTSETFNLLFKLKCLRSLCSPGEAVGVLAAQSIGEPSTQMTLNTFHFAGRGEMNVTLGIPRLREILMTASSNIKTPSMTVPLLPTTQAMEKGQELKKLFARVCLADVLEKVELWECQVMDDHLSRAHQIRIKFSLLPHHLYSNMFVVTPKTVVDHIKKKFLKELVRRVNLTIKNIEKKSSHVVVEESVDNYETSRGNDDADAEDDTSAPKTAREDDDDAQSEAEGNEEDGTVFRDKQQQLSYEEPDVDELAIQQEMDEQVASDMEEDQEEMAATTEADQNMDHGRILEVEDIGEQVTQYTYDTKGNMWCQATLKFPVVDNKILLGTMIQTLAEKSVVSEVPGIKRAFLAEETVGTEKEWTLKTEGINIPVLWEHPDVFDVFRIYCNDIHCMKGIYGIEAARKIIIKEIKNVFGVYGITVDYRHLSLLADYMTYEGSYKSFGRIGIDSNSSPFQKMTFETTMAFLRKAALYRETDHVQSPSACLVTGQVIRSGTGSFELMQPLTKKC